jgi:hypothetical protein
MTENTATAESGDNKIIAQNEAFLLNDPATRLEYKGAYEATRAIYYKGQPAFSNILERIHAHIDRLSAGWRISAASGGNFSSPLFLSPLARVFAFPFSPCRPCRSAPDSGSGA